MDSVSLLGLAWLACKAPWRDPYATQEFDPVFGVGVMDKNSEPFRRHWPSPSFPKAYGRPWVIPPWRNNKGPDDRLPSRLSENKAEPSLRSCRPLAPLQSRSVSLLFLIAFG